MSETTKVGKRYAVVVPKSVRKRVKLEEGQRVWIRADHGRVIIEPLPKDPSLVYAELIPDQYTETKYEKKAKELLMKNARARH